MKKKSLLLTLMITLLGVVMAATVLFTHTASQGTFSPFWAVPTESPTPTPMPTAEPTPTPFMEYDINLLALGDNLMHLGVINTGREEDGTYDYSFLFENIRPFLDLAEINVINQETILGGNHLGFSGYPAFNSPTEVGDAIAAAGFNVVLHGSNHATDKGLEGLNNCLAFWEENYPDILICGIEEDLSADTEIILGPEIPLLEIEGKTFAFLNYTYSNNHGTLAKEYHGRLKMLCNVNPDTGAMDFTSLNPQVLEEIAAAREIADVVVVLPHWGTEYQPKQSAYQTKFAQQIADAGADLIVGTHPHVPQPIEWITSQDGRQVLCYYSLGNYVSTQKQALTMLEGLAWVTFHVTETDIYIEETKTGVVPLVCHYKYGPVRVENIYLLEEYTEEMASRHGIWQYGEVPLHLSDLQQNSETIFGDWVLDSCKILEE